MLLGGAWAVFDGMFILALRGDCQSELAWMRMWDSSVPDSYCGISWWLPPLRTWLVEGLLPALVLVTAVWFWVSRKKQT